MEGANEAVAGCENGQFFGFFSSELQVFPVPIDLGLIGKASQLDILQELVNFPVIRKQGEAHFVSKSLHLGENGTTLKREGVG